MYKLNIKKDKAAQEQEQEQEQEQVPGSKGHSRRFEQ